MAKASKRVLNEVTGQFEPFVEPEESKALRKKLGLGRGVVVGPNTGYDDKKVANAPVISTTPTPINVPVISTTPTPIPVDTNEMKTIADLNKMPAIEVTTYAFEVMKLPEEHTASKAKVIKYLRSQKAAAL